jgi:hypothetical protein
MTLSVYSEKQCQGEMIHYTLTKTPQSLVDDFLGSFTGTEVTFQQGQSAVGWVYNLPSALQVPRFTNGWEYLAIVGFIWSIAAFVYSFVYSLRKFLKSRTITMIMMMVSNFILLAWICIRIGYIYTIFLDDATFYTVSDAEKIMLNLGTLSVSFYTAKFLGTVRSYTSKENLALFFGLFLFHITFAGYQYFVPFIKVGRGSFMESWDMISYWWIIIWFIWDMLPIFAILYRMVESTGAQTLLERVKVVFETDKIFIATVFAQVFNTVLYFVIVYLQDSTTILGSDFVFTAFACYKAVCISVHSVLNAYMIERMRSIMKSINKTIGTKTLGTDSAVKSQIKNTSTVASSVPIVKK